MNKLFSFHFNPTTRCSRRFLLALSLALLPAIAPAQSVWRDDVSKPMYADKRATGVGDILTIVVQENTSANKNNETKTERQSSLNAAISSFLYSPGASKLLTKGGQLPAMAFNSDAKHDGSGSINNSETLIARVAVRVIDVLPNQNLVIEGRRETAFGGERQTIILHGIIRLDDVAANNTVFSYNVSDATIQVIGKGTVTDSTRKGWFNRLWDKINPF
jgi:flagellar L-ring protein precursor FlgH